jgi:hypothetical protein
MKTMLFDPRVKEIVDASRSQLDKLKTEREAELKAFEAD